MSYLNYFLIISRLILLICCSTSNNSIDNGSYLDLVKKRKGYTLILFFKNDCSSCSKIETKFKKITKKYNDKNIFFGKINLSKKENIELKNSLNIKFVPQFILFYNGKEIQNITHTKDKNILENVDDVLNKYLK